MTDDDDDIAYVGDEDDEQGPGCLVVLAVVASAFGVAGCVGSMIWWIVIVGNGANAPPFAVVSGVYLMLVMGLTVIAGGFGLGVGIYSSIKARLSPRPWLRPVALTAAAAGLVSVIGIVLLVTFLISGFRLR